MSVGLHFLRRGGNLNLQGGAIYADVDGVDLKISSSTFEQNQATRVSMFECLSSQMKFHKIQILACLAVPIGTI